MCFHSQSDSAVAALKRADAVIHRSGTQPQGVPGDKKVEVQELDVESEDEDTQSENLSQDASDVIALKVRGPLVCTLTLFSFQPWPPPPDSS